MKIVAIIENPGPSGYARIVRKMDVGCLPHGTPLCVIPDWTKKSDAFLDEALEACKLAWKTKYQAENPDAPDWEKLSDKERAQSFGAFLLIEVAKVSTRVLS